ncbi:hypothetical protein IMAU10585_01681 [Lactiplantibacillus plantarum]|uniref:helix-turn-helix domain-containing protein n=1 Tax=Lactiplantibacillus plantarum TaxID=1590 RepID=UPI001FB9A0FD|nr:helix-turn-helix domain-containing protein [Lactiplantibacillus plantarum]MCG0758394.1 hypothetical protein [Lactiplantibacillus plantarum]MCG0775676.1 hypothetical protein [Lactiplantibacillus plantarum]MCG0868582.1 hypothetical protein [Lactiplantibacillus plantarum]
MKSISGPLLLSIPKAALFLGVDRTTVETMLNDPLLPRITVGRSNQVRISKLALLEYIDHSGKNWFERN